VDEAGQIGGRQMEALCNLAHRHAARLILSGDTRQHPAVEASDAMRSLEAFSRVRIAEIKTVRRQDPRLGKSTEERAQIAAYRKAVEDASAGQVEAALAQLVTSGFVHDTRGGDVVAPVADEYDRLQAEGLRVLAVSQTRETVRQLNDAITARLLARGVVREPRSLEAFLPRDTHQAEKSLPDTYEPGMTLQILRNYSALERGDLVTVETVTPDALTVVAGSGLRRRVALKYAARWEILDRHEITAGIGSLLQLRANGLSREGRKFCNGEHVTIRSFHDDGSIGVVDRDGAALSLWPDQRVLQPGYAVTSYGAQGKTTDAVLLADSGVAAASHQKEWYVSISRARRRIAVYTPDVAGLATRIAASGERMLGLELLPNLRPLVNAGLRSLIHESIDRAHRVIETVGPKFRP
jgi:ATP-dependent exoDNAse (exonuclease V) alpha subunit